MADAKIVDEMCEVAAVAFMCARGENGTPITNPLNPQYSCEAVTRFIIETALSAAEVHGYVLVAKRSIEDQRGEEE